MKHIRINLVGELYSVKQFLGHSKISNIINVFSTFLLLVIPYTEEIYTFRTIFTEVLINPIYFKL